MTNQHTLYLNGIKAYMANTYGRSIRVNKRDFTQLIGDNIEEMDVIVPEATAPKYAKQINRLGFVLATEEQYSDLLGELKLHYKRIRYNGRE